MLIQIVYSLHLVVFALWTVPFLIPSRLWKNKLPFHFLFMLVVILSNYLTGFYYLGIIGKYIPACPLTILLQYLRDYSIKAPLTYNHSFITEFLQSFGLNLAISIKPWMWLTFLIVAVQFYLRRKAL